MSSVNDHLQSPPKPRMSPLEFRNTDLVSRLLAATPPYLYNMSLLPNTYFFSEMLRSFVQAKVERNAQTMQPPIKRSRKRNWMASRMENLQKQASPEVKSEEKNDGVADWMIKSNKKVEDNPLELTTKAVESSGDFSAKSDTFSPKLEPHQSIPEQTFPNPNIHSNYSHENSAQNLVLPPPPPMWYPPLYPAPPYGIDPLHFFIDLRVSGHIYDKKYQKDSTALATVPSTMNKEKLQQTEISELKTEEDGSSTSFKQSRHCSAFSVPVPSSLKKTQSEKEMKSTKFDVKSLGFDKIPNKTSINYVMNNISSIYSNISSTKQDTADVHRNRDHSEQTSEREKKMKDLRAMIGLELVVDYMKPKLKDDDSSSTTDMESVGSPALEVVAVNDDN